MPGIVRVGLDAHIGHASTTPNAFHQTKYAEGSPDVYVNGAKAVRIGDTTSCGDPATGSSPDVYVNGILVHRLSDATDGHGSWVPNAATTASTNVFANGGEGTTGTFTGPTSTAVAGVCLDYNWNTLTCDD